MTSEGQQAGQQPTEATSGSPAEAFGPDGFPADSEPPSRSSAQPGTGFPTSYAPPPQSTPNGGSPFVVPTVFGQPAERPFPDPPADRYDSPTALPGQADSAERDRATPPPFAPPATGYTPPPATGSSRITGSASARLPGSDSPFGAASLPSRDNSSPPSAWAPREAAAPAEPHPYRSADGPAGEIAGFAPGSPTRGRGGLDDDPNSGSEQSPFGAPAESESPGANRPPGLSAFGDQRVRVPGATLTDLPDGVPSVPPAREPNSGGVTRRDGDGSALPRRTAPSGDPLLSFGSTADSFQGFKPTGSGRSGGSADSRGSSAGPYTPRASQAFGANRGPGSPGLGGGQPSGAPASSAPGDDRTSSAPGDSPFGRQPGEPFRAQPQSDSPFGGQSSFGGGSGGPPAPPATSPYGSGPTSDGFQFGAPPVPAGGSPFRPAPTGSPFGETVSDEPMFGSRPATPDDAPQPYSSTGQGGSSPFGPPAAFGPAGDSPFARRVPGASLGSDGAPVAPAESRNGSVPQPRDPAERPAMGTARAVSASASVPTASRVTPVDAEEIPPPSAVPQARVYGRAAPPADTDDDADRDDHSMQIRPDQAADQVPPYARNSENQQPAVEYGRPVDPNPNGQGDPYGRPVDADPNRQGPNAPGGVPPFGRQADADQGGPVAFTPAPFSRPGAEGPNGPGGFGSAPVTPYARRVEDDQNGPGGNLGSAEAQPPAVAPQSPGRASGRATASARVTPPPAGLPGAPTPPDHYGEHTTDISRRGQSDQPYVPAPALPSLHARPPLENGFPPPLDGTESPDRMRLGGVFPGPANRGTVTPPNPDETTSWPQPGEPQQSQNVGWPQPGEPEQDRFAQFKPEDAASAPAAPSTPHVRMVPVIIGVIIGAALVVGITLGIVWLIARGSDPGGISVGAGDCVKRSGDQAIKATCGDPGTFQVVSVAATKDKCGDPTQPYVVNPTDNGKTQVLCLKPSS